MKPLSTRPSMRSHPSAPASSTHSKPPRRQRAAKKRPPKQRPAPPSASAPPDLTAATLLDVVVRSLTRDDHIMHMALPQPGVRDTNKPRIRLQLRNRRAPQISHSRTQPSDQLIHHPLQRPTMRHPALNPLRHKLRQPIRSPILPSSQRRPLRTCRILHIVLALKIPLARPLRHRRQRTHPAISLERPPLIQNRLARALIHSGKQRPHHHHARPRRNRLRHVARIFNPTIRNHRNPPLLARAISLRDRRNLRHPSPRHHARRADRARPNPNLDRIRSSIDQRHRPLIRSNIPRHQIDLRKPLLHLSHLLQHTRRVPMPRIHPQPIHPRRHQPLRPLPKPPRSPPPPPPPHPPPP